MQGSDTKCWTRSDTKCWSRDDAKCGSKIQCQHSHKDISVKEINVLGIRKINHRKVKQMQTRVIYPGSVLVTYIQSPSLPLEIFLYPWLCTPKINTLHTTWQISFAKCVQLLLQPREQTPPCKPLFYTKKTLLYNDFFEWLQPFL